MTTLTIPQLKELQTALQGVLTAKQHLNNTLIEIRSLYYAIDAYLYFLEASAKAKMSIEIAQQTHEILQNLANKINNHRPLPLAA